MKYKFHGWENALQVHAINHDYAKIEIPCDLYKALLKILARRDS